MMLQISITRCQIEPEIHSFPTMYGKGDGGGDGGHLHPPAGEDDEDDRGVADHGGQGDRAVEQRDHDHLAQLRNDNCTSSLVEPTFQ